MRYVDTQHMPFVLALFSAVNISLLLKIFGAE
jgi:hypothetical protein